MFSIMLLMLIWVSMRLLFTFFHVLSSGPPVQEMCVLGSLFQDSELKFVFLSASMFYGFLGGLIYSTTP